MLDCRRDAVRQRIRDPSFTRLVHQLRQLERGAHRVGESRDSQGATTTAISSSTPSTAYAATLAAAVAATAVASAFTAATFATALATPSTTTMVLEFVHCEWNRHEQQWRVR